MRVLSIVELMLLSRPELCGLAAEFEAKVSRLRLLKPKRALAEINLRNICYVLARRDFAL